MRADIFQDSQNLLNLFVVTLFDYLPMMLYRANTLFDYLPIMLYS